MVRPSTLPATSSPYCSEMAVNNSRRARASRKRQRRMKRVEHDLEPAQWNALVDAWDGCAYCGATDQPLQKDCVMALSRGGRYTLDNIVPACRSCNASKCNAEVTSWMRRKRLDEQLFLVRFHQVTVELTERFAPAGDAEPEGSDTAAESSVPGLS